jgi:hypothetical protein
MSLKINKSLIEDIRAYKTSLGNHPAFPEGDESSFEEKLILKRFDDVEKRFKRYNNEVSDVLTLDQNTLMLLRQIGDIESNNTEELISLAKELIYNEFDLTDEDVDIEMDLVDFTSNLEGEVTTREFPEKVDIEFESNQSLRDANKEVYKRRYLNAMIQGCAKKTNHMFNLIDTELEDIEPTLPDLYSKLMSSADLSYFIRDYRESNKVRYSGGYNKIEIQSNDKPKVYAKAICFPVLINELVKGLLEVLILDALPKDYEVSNYVLAKSDFTSAEAWDMMLGAGLWEKFNDLIPLKYSDYKYNLFNELASLPVDEFNELFADINLGTKKAVTEITNRLADIEDDIKNSEYDKTIDGYFDFTDIDDISDLDLNI